MLRYGLLVLVPPPAYMAVLMLLTGVFLAPMLTATFVLVGELAPPGTTTTEAFAWLATLFAAGTSLGSAAVGNVLAHTNEHWAALCGTAGALVTLTNPRPRPAGLLRRSCVRTGPGRCRLGPALSVRRNDNAGFRNSGSGSRRCLTT